MENVICVNYYASTSFNNFSASPTISVMVSATTFASSKKYPEIFHKSAGVATSCPKYCLVKIADSTLALSNKTLASKTLSSDLFIISAAPFYCSKSANT